MKRTLTGTLAAIVAGAAMVAAQGNQPRPGSTPQPSSAAPQSSAPSSTSQASSKGSAASKADAITYTGCLEAGTTPGTYVLANASDSAKPAAKSAGAMASASTEEKFLLSGAPSNFNMSSNVNHKVEITGTVAEAKTSAAAPAGANAGAASEPATKTITVTSARVLSDRCSTR